MEIPKFMSKCWKEYSDAKVSKLKKQWETTENRYIRSLFLQYIQMYVLKDERTEHKKTCLDLACGSGELAIPLHDVGFQVTGIDINQQFLKILDAEKGDRKITIICGDLFSDIPQQRYDLIVARFLFNHFHNTFELMDLCHKHLNPGGFIIFNHINRNAVYLAAFIEQQPFNKVYKSLYGSKSSVDRHALLKWCIANNMRILEHVPYLFFVYAPLFKNSKAHRFLFEKNEMYKSFDEKIARGLPIDMHGQLLTIIQKA